MSFWALFTTQRILTYHNLWICIACSHSYFVYVPLPILHTDRKVRTFASSPPLYLSLTSHESVWAHINFYPLFTNASITFSASSCPTTLRFTLGPTANDIMICLYRPIEQYQEFLVTPFAIIEEINQVLWLRSDSTFCSARVLFIRWLRVHKKDKRSYNTVLPLPYGLSWIVASAAVELKLKRSILMTFRSTLSFFSLCLSILVTIE